MIVLIPSEAGKTGKKKERGVLFVSILHLVVLLSSLNFSRIG